MEYSNLPEVYNDTRVPYQHQPIWVPAQPSAINELPGTTPERPAGDQNATCDERKRISAPPVYTERIKKRSCPPTVLWLILVIFFVALIGLAVSLGVVLSKKKHGSGNGGSNAGSGERYSNHQGKGGQ
jgi:hypothetical protein